MIILLSCAWFHLRGVSFNIRCSCFILINDHRLFHNDSSPLAEVEDKYERDYGIAAVDFHESYNVGPYLNNDLALIHTDADVALNEHVAPICLPPANYIYRWAQLLCKC